MLIVFQDFRDPTTCWINAYKAWWIVIIPKLVDIFCRWTFFISSMIPVSIMWLFPELWGWIPLHIGWPSSMCLKLYLMIIHMIIMQLDMCGTSIEDKIGCFINGALWLTHYHVVRKRFVTWLCSRFVRNLVWYMGWCTNMIPLKGTLVAT